MKQNKTKRQRIRSGMLIGTFWLFPLIFSYFSPYLFIWGASQGIVTTSFFTFVTLFFLALFLGRAVCGWVMPCGGIQEILCAVNDKESGKGKTRYIKYILFVPWIIAAITLVFQAGGYHKVDYFFHLKNGISVHNLYMYIPYYIVLLLFTLISVIWGKRANCHYLCWMSPFMIMGKKVSRFLTLPSLRIKTASDGCNQCKRCSRECPMSLPVHQMVNGGTIEHSDCILCGRCADVCSKKIFTYKFCRPLIINQVQNKNMLS